MIESTKLTTKLATKNRALAADDGGLGETRPTAVAQSAPQARPEQVLGVSGGYVISPAGDGGLQGRGGVNAAAADDDGGLGETRPTAVAQGAPQFGEVSATG